MSVNGKSHNVLSALFELVMTPMTFMMNLFQTGIPGLVFMVVAGIVTWLVYTKPTGKLGPVVRRKMFGADNNTCQYNDKSCYCPSVAISLGIGMGIALGSVLVLMVIMKLFEGHQKQF